MKRVVFVAMLPQPHGGERCGLAPTVLGRARFFVISRLIGFAIVALDQLIIIRTAQKHLVGWSQGQVHSAFFFTLDQLHTSLFACVRCQIQLSPSTFLLQGYRPVVGRRADPFLASVQGTYT